MAGCALAALLPAVLRPRGRTHVCQRGERGWICKMKPNDNPGPRRTLLKADKQLPKPTSGSSPRKDQNLAVRLHPLLPESAEDNVSELVEWPQVLQLKAELSVQLTA